jgi:glutamyl-tRNA reductase
MPAGVLGLDALRVYSWDIASLTPASLLALEAEIGSLTGWSEVFPIVTCQRYEIVAVDETACLSAPRAFRGLDAVRHLARLAGGLESLVLGEPEILGQVRSAFTAAPAPLRRLVTPAISTARALRREAAFSAHAGHALDLAIEHAGLVLEGRLLVVGGGPMGRRVAERAAQLGFDVTLVARRPPPLPPGVAYKPFSALGELGATDVLVACLGRTAPQLGAGDLPAVRRLAIDLATPRNLKADLDAPVVTLSDLLESHRSAPRDAELRRALCERLDVMLATRLATARPDSPLGTLRNEVERIRQRELTRSLRLHPDLPADKLDTITRSLVNQIFHRPSQRLRQAEDQELAAAFAALFQPRAKEEAHDSL